MTHCPKDQVSLNVTDLPLFDLRRLARQYGHVQRVEPFRTLVDYSFSGGSSACGVLFEPGAFRERPGPECGLEWSARTAAIIGSNRYPRVGLITRLLNLVPVCPSLSKIQRTPFVVPATKSVRWIFGNTRPGSHGRSGSGAGPPPPPPELTTRVIPGRIAHRHRPLIRCIRRLSASRSWMISEGRLASGLRSATPSRRTLRLCSPSPRRRTPLG